MNLNEQKKVAKDECMEAKKKYHKTIVTGKQIGRAHV